MDVDLQGSLIIHWYKETSLINTLSLDFVKDVLSGLRKLQTRGAASFEQLL